MTKGPGCSDHLRSARPTGTGSACARAGSGEKLRRRFTSYRLAELAAGFNAPFFAVHAALSRQSPFCSSPNIT